MKKTILLLCLSILSLAVCAQSLTIKGEFDENKNNIFDLTPIKKYALVPYYKEYTKNRVLLKDSNFSRIGLYYGYHFKRYYINLSYEYLNDSIKFKILELGKPMYQPKLSMKPLSSGNKSGEISPYTVLIHNILEIRFTDESISEEIVCGVVCQDYWDPVNKSYKKCDFDKYDYKTHSEHYYEICLRFLKDDNAVGKFVDLYEKH